MHKIKDYSRIQTMKLSLLLVSSIECIIGVLVVAFGLASVAAIAEKKWRVECKNAGIKRRGLSSNRSNKVMSKVFLGVAIYLNNSNRDRTPSWRWHA